MPKLSGNAGFRVQLESQGKTRNNHHLRSKTFELGRKLLLGTPLRCSCIALLSYIPVTMHFLHTIHTMDIND